MGDRQGTAVKVSTTLAVAIAACLVGAASASAWTIRSPSGNIVCGEDRGAVACLIFKQSFVEPRPCDGTYTATGTVRRRGRARLNIGCFSGLPFEAGRATTLGYGDSSTHRGVRCRSTERGMRCRNRDGHGFSISRRRGYTF